MDLEPGGIPSLTRRLTLRLGARILSLLGIGATVAGARSVTAKKKGKGKGKKKRGKGKKKGQVVLLQAADMTGAKEVPGPGDENASGTGIFTFRPNGTVCSAFTFSDEDESPVIAFHIHSGGPGTAGPPVINFNGQLNTCVPVAKGLANQIKANPGGFYANIHTDDFPDGAVRDQLSAV